MILFYFFGGAFLICTLRKLYKGCSSIYCLQAVRLREEELAREIEALKHQIQEIEQLARGRGLAGMFKVRHPQTEQEKSATPA